MNHSPLAHTSRDQIVVGDSVLIKAPEATLDAVLQADGVLLVSGCHLACPPIDFHDCEFVITVQQQYSAELDFEDFLKKEVPKDSVEQQTLHKMDRIMLNKARENETQLNQSYVRSSVGQAVKFGQTIQLKHKQSGLYLSINEHKKAGIVSSVCVLSSRF